MTVLIILLILLNLYLISEVNDLRAQTAITKASFFGMKEHIYDRMSEALDDSALSDDLACSVETLEILKKQLELCEQEVSATHDAFHGLDLNYQWLKEKVERLNIEALENLNIDDVIALQKVIELDDLDVWLEETTEHLVSSDDLNEALDDALSNLVVKRRGEP